jgi:hypothetical protein
VSASTLGLKGSTDSFPVLERAIQVLGMFLFDFLVLLLNFFHGGSGDFRVRIASPALYVRALGGYGRSRTVAVLHVNEPVSERPAAFINLAGKIYRITVLVDVVKRLCVIREFVGAIPIALWRLVYVPLMNRRGQGLILLC